MFDLDTAVRSWRGTLRSERTLSADQLDELEDHIRSTHSSLVEAGLRPGEAWAYAREVMGTSRELTAEFRKVEGSGWRWFLRAGWAMFLVAFLLPAHSFTIELFDVGGEWSTAGYEAFVLALFGEGGWAGVASALTNLLIPLTMWRIAERSRQGLLALAGATGLATLLNGWWMFVVDAVPELQFGYYLWWCSFAYVSVGLALRLKTAPEGSEASDRLLPAR